MELTCRKTRPGCLHLEVRNHLLHFSDISVRQLHTGPKRHRGAGDEEELSTVGAGELGLELQLHTSHTSAVPELLPGSALT